MNGYDVWPAVLKFCMETEGWNVGKLGLPLVIWGTNEFDGTKVEFRGTKSPDVALKGFIVAAAGFTGLTWALSVGLAGSLQVETSVDAGCECEELRSELFD